MASHAQNKARGLMEIGVLASVILLAPYALMRILRATGVSYLACALMLLFAVTLLL
jgi:hypothetical protein